MGLPDASPPQLQPSVQGRELLQEHGQQPGAVVLHPGPGDPLGSLRRPPLW